MTTQPSERTGILIVRLWSESVGLDGFRARITQKLDSKSEEHTSIWASRAEDLYTAVRAWVEAFVDSE